MLAIMDRHTVHQSLLCMWLCRYRLINVHILDNTPSGMVYAMISIMLIPPNPKCKVYSFNSLTAPRHMVGVTDLPPIE